MTNYNERLDEILEKFRDSEQYSNGFDGYENIFYTKQSITSLIEELVAEAKIDELKHLVYDDGIWYEDMTRQFPQKITFNQRIKELEAWTN